VVEHTRTTRKREREPGRTLNNKPNNTHRDHVCMAGCPWSWQTTS